MKKTDITWNDVKIILLSLMTFILGASSLFCMGTGIMFLLTGNITTGLMGIIVGVMSGLQAGRYAYRFKVACRKYSNIKGNNQ